MNDLTKYICFNKRLQKLRTERGLSQVELASSLCVTKQSVSNWENDNIMPSVDMLVKIASLFSVTTDYLLGLDDKKIIDVGGLTEKQILHIQQIAEDFTEVNKIS